ncbi:D-tyrosyl-tRNA(Tyr) deacylase [Candidatus Sumerlaeota bacterium]|nr:D-tyrosyl-tRNA(Tyr) deacylase [Candidatus Sumerlaeota bacterium]
MRIVLQRVSKASVRVEEKTTGQIDRGFLVLAGIAQDDSEEDYRFIAEKIVNLRVFEDDGGKMNRSLLDVGGALLVVSQFTLFADCRKGRRPSFIEAAPPQKASVDFDLFVNILRQYGVKVETGIFGAMMDVELINDGPVTIILDSKEMKSVSRRGNPRNINEK